ncbi:MAG: class I SAM-dependent methyltransferase [Clostridia bacterium]|nr:class I SAM-dependent methyltransferase [Clostridia bacterium]
MDKIKCYENPLFENFTGDTIRPGGFELTRAAIHFCQFDQGACLLDIGCGKGATVEYMEKQYHYLAVGIDASEKLIYEGLKRNPSLNLLVGNSEKLPLNETTMDGVIAECSFSLMQDKKAVLNEIKRVLKPNGKFIISDMYFRNNEAKQFSQDILIETCILNAFVVKELKEFLIRNGFKVILFEDYTHRLQELMAEIIMEYGSLNYFWEKITDKSIDCDKMSCSMGDVKLGYFLCIAELVS